MPTGKDYQQEIRRFISSQHLYTGVRLTAAVIIPVLILYKLGLLDAMMGIPLGAVFIGLTDNPGPIPHRRNGLLIATCLVFFSSLIAGLSRFNPVLTGVEIAVLGILFSLFGVYGTRASSIGLTALIVFLLGIDREHTEADAFQESLYYFAGGLWYTVVSLGLYTLRPYRPIQQLLGECLMTTSAYVITKSQFYSPGTEPRRVFTDLIGHQVRIHQFQEQLRSMLFTTRRFVSESTYKGRILMMLFRESVDLFEKIATTQQEYSQLHESFGDTEMPELLRQSVIRLGNELYRTGLAVQEGEPYLNEAELESAYRVCADAFARLRAERLGPGSVVPFIRLRHTLNSIRDVSDRIRRIQKYTSLDRELAGQYRQEEDLEKFVSYKEIQLRMLLSAFTLKSDHFRHAVRLTTALFAGYLISLFFPFGHGYWILLTIATIIKPAYGLTTQRNIQRLTGTFVGAVIGFLLLFVMDQFAADRPALLFVAMLATMVLSYSTIKIHYGLSVGSLTVFLLLSIQFLDPAGFNAVLQDRVVDTFIGSAIAYLVSRFILPSRTQAEIGQLILTSLETDRHYFRTVAQSFTGTPASTTDYKMARKDAFVALANLSDAFQRMISDPRNQGEELPIYHQLVADCHMLTSHIASLSDYAQQYGGLYASPEFQPLISLVDKSFRHVLEGREVGVKDSEIRTTPIMRRVLRLHDERKRELESGIVSSQEETRRLMSVLTTITDQFQLIHAATEDAARGLARIRPHAS